MLIEGAEAQVDVYVAVARLWKQVGYAIDPLSQARWQSSAVTCSLARRDGRRRRATSAPMT